MREMVESKKNEKEALMRVQDMDVQMKKKEEMLN